MELQPHEMLKVCRVRKGYTQDDLARMLHCSQMEVSRLERGKQPTNDIQTKIESIFDTQIWPEKVVVNE